MFNIPEDIPPSSFQASLPVSTEVAGICSMTDLLKKGNICRFLFIGESVREGVMAGGKTHNVLTPFIIDVLLQGSLAQHQT